MNNTQVNHFLEVLDLEVCKTLVEHARKNKTMEVLCPHYSINIQSKYDDGEQMDWDFDELEQELGATLSVNDYDDLIVDCSDTED